MTFRLILTIAVSVGWVRVPAALARLAPEQRRQLVIRAGGSLIAVAALLAWITGPLLQWGRIDHESFRIAAGLVLAVVGLVRIVGAGLGEEGTTVQAAGLVPVLYPVLLGPEAVLAFMSVGVDRGVALAAVGAALGALLAVAVSRAESVRAGLWRALARLNGVALVVLAVALVFDGLRDV